MSTLSPAQIPGARYSLRHACPRKGWTQNGGIRYDMGGVGVLLGWLGHHAEWLWALGFSTSLPLAWRHPKG